MLMGFRKLAAGFDRDDVGDITCQIYQLKVACYDRLVFMVVSPGLRVILDLDTIPCELLRLPIDSDEMDILLHLMPEDGPP